MKKTLAKILPVAFLILFTSLSSGCIEKKIRDLESPCAASSINPSAQDPCVRRPVNIGVI